MGTSEVGITLGVKSGKKWAVLDWAYILWWGDLKIGGSPYRGARGPLPIGPLHRKPLWKRGWGGVPLTIPSSQILYKMTLSLSMSMPVNGDYTFYIDKLKVPTHVRAPPPSLPFPYSAMWFGHDCQATWQNMEMDTGKFRIYRILKGGKDTSPVEKKGTCTI